MKGFVMNLKMVNHQDAIDLIEIFELLTQKDRR